MKNKIFRPILTLLVSLFALTSCFDSPGNYETGYGFATVVSYNSGNTLYFLDGAQKVYYYSPEVNGSKDALMPGDRLYLQTFTIDRDNQAEGTLGTEKNPVKMSDVYFAKLDNETPVQRSEQTDRLKNDKLETITLLGITPATLHNDYLNLGVAYYRNEKTGYDFNLVHDVTRNDTVFYTFKATNNADVTSSTLLVNTIKSYNLGRIADKCHVAITFSSKMYPSAANYRLVDSTYIMPFTRPSLD
ncbi:MAG: hypothetical protein RR202_00465 [Bacteroidales bacterium]